MFLYHYYDSTTGAFRNLSDLPANEANKVLDAIRKDKPNSQCAVRQTTYMQDRLHYEAVVRNEFIKKGGKIERKAPYYMIVEHSPWLNTWYENPAFIKIPIEEFDTDTLSFTYYCVREIIRILAISGIKCYNGQFTTNDARIKLAKLYPIFSNYFTDVTLR